MKWRGGGVRLPEIGRDEGREALEAVAVEGRGRVEFEGLGVRKRERDGDEGCGLVVVGEVGDEEGGCDVHGADLRVLTADWL